MGHWYDTDGKPMHYVETKKGTVSTTLAHARKYNLVPSVTGILDVQKQYMLENWIQEQIIKAAIEFPYKKGEDERAYTKKIRAISQKIPRETAKTGSFLDEQLTKYFSKEPVQPDYLGVCRRVDNILSRKYGNQQWITQHTFYSELGYGGAVDLYSPVAVVDYKERNFESEKDKPWWDKDCLQLTAYRMGIGLLGAARTNIYVSRQNGKIILKEWEGSHYEDWFEALLRIWQHSKKYYPNEDNL